MSSLTIPGSVSSIGSYAFRDCINLTGVTFSSGVGIIGESAFRGCSRISSLTIPGSVSSIGENAFSDCKDIRDIIVQQGVSSIRDYAFSGCTRLTIITIPQSVESVGSKTFTSCPNLSSLTWYYNPNYSAMDLNLRNYLTNVVFNDTITTIGANAFWYCSKLTSIKLPAGLTSIREHAFSVLSGLTQIIIPISVTSIGAYAFSACNSLKIYNESNSKPGGWDLNWNPSHSPEYYYSAVSKINCWRYVNNMPTLWSVEGTQGLEYSLLSDGTFSLIGVKNLSTIVIPSIYNGLPVSKVGNGSAVLANSEDLQTVVINGGVKSIESYAFSDCSWLSSVTIPDSVTNIGANAFKNCSILTTVPIFDNVTNIGASAFSGCTRLTSVTIPQSVVSIGENAFADCAPSLYILWNYNSALTAASFNKCHYEVNFPVGISQISANAFAGSTALNILTIPSSVTSVGANAFANCNPNLSITWNYNPALTSANFSAFLIRVNFGSGITSITSDAFANCKQLLSISIPSTVTSIGNSAFSDCTRIQSLNIPSGVTTIGSNAFYGCTEATYFTIPYSVTSVGTNAFAGNPNYIVSWNYNPLLTAENFGSVLQYVYWPSGLTSISANAFKGCIKLTNLSIPISVTNIGNSVFYGCTGLTSFSIPGSVTSIGNSAFYGCTGFSKIFITGNVITMGTNVFQNCSNLYIYTGETSKPSGWNASWNSSNRPVYWRVNSNTIDIFSSFGYSGSTYYWNGAVQMRVSNTYYYNTNNGNYLLRNDATLTFNVRTLNKKNAFSKINGTLNFQLKNSSGTVLITNFSTVVVSKLSAVTLSGDSFSISTADLSNGTYTLTMTSSFTRGSWSESSTHTFTLIIDK